MEDNRDSRFARRAAFHLERFHDLRLVWTPRLSRAAALVGHTGELVHRAPGILFCGPGQSPGQLPFFRGRAQSDAGGHHPLGIRHFLGALSRAALDSQSPARLRSYRAWRRFRLQWTILTWSELVLTNDIYDN